MQILALSPHRGDAALSLSLSIPHWLGLGHRVTILTVFTRSLHAPYSDIETVHQNDRLTYVAALRRREDEAFLKLILTRKLPRSAGLSFLDLNLKDAPIRLRNESASVQEMPFNPEDSALPRLLKAIEAHLALPHPALVVPLALGRHIDHRVVREAALPFTAALPTAFYEDLPDAASETISNDDPTLTPALSAPDAAFKRKVANLYTSHIGTAEADLIANYHQGAERLWTNPLWQAAFPVHD